MGLLEPVGGKQGIQFGDPFEKALQVCGEATKVPAQGRVICSSNLKSCSESLSVGENAMKVAILVLSAALLGLGSPLIAGSASEPSDQDSSAAAQNRDSTIDAAECDAEAEKAYPSHVVGVGKKRKALISVCMQRKTQPVGAPRSISMDKVECEGESYKVYPPQIWGGGKKRRAQYSACMVKRGWTGDAIKP